MIKDPKILKKKMLDLAGQIRDLKTELRAVGLFDTLNKLEDVQTGIYKEIQEKTDVSYM